MKWRPRGAAALASSAVVAACVAATWLLVLSYDATVAVKVTAAIVAAYIILSLFLHPIWSIREHPFSLLVMSKLMIVSGLVFNCLFVSSAAESLGDRTAIFILLSGLAAVAGADVGTCLMRPPTVSLEPRSEERPIAVVVFIVLFCAGWVWRLYALSTGRLYGTIIGTGLDLTGESNILGVMNTVAGIAAWGAMIFWKRRRLAILMIVSEALWLMITGSKGSILYVLITYLMLTTGGRARAVTGRTVAVACVGFVLFAAGFVIVHSYRVAAETQINRRGFASFNPIEAVTEMKITGEEFQHVGLAISKRLNLARRLSLILDTPESEQEPPWLGRTYLMSVMWAVPRAVWPDKPSMSLGRWYATKYYGWGKRIKGEAGPTIWGEAYLNFRGTGMMVIPALWLIFLQFVYIFSWRIGPWGLLFLAKIYLVAMNSLASNVSMVVATMGQATLIVLLLYLLTRVVGVCRVRLREVRA